VFHGVTLDGRFEGFGLGLVDELGRVDADRDQDVGELGFEGAQLVEDLEKLTYWQQKDQKSSRTTLPRRSLSAMSCPPVLSQPRPTSSGARTRARRR
jgi:hypothetical protein